MYFLIDACQHPTILRVLYFVYLLLDIVFIAVPIGLIVMLMIDFSKAVITNNEKEQLKSTKLVTNRIMYAVIIFAIPWIVNILMIFLDEVGLDLGGDYRVCITNVNEIRNETQTFEYYDELLEIEEAEEEVTNSGNSNAPSNSESGSVGSGGSDSSGNVSGGSIYESAADALVNTAMGELGKTYNAKYGGNAGGWCAAFVHWSLVNTRLSDGTLYDYINKDNHVSNPYAASGLWPAFKNSKHLSYNISNYYGGNYTPKKGDIVWFQWDKGYCRSNYGEWDKVNVCSDHAAIVVSVEGENFTTMDGNSGGKVSKNSAGSRNINSKNVIAFGSWYK